MWARTAQAPRDGRTSRVLGAWRWLRSLSVAVIGISALLFLATAVAGTASVRSVARQDDLLISEAILADVTADAGRAEALVAQLADPRTNPAFLSGMRAELSGAAGRISADALRLQQQSASNPALGNALASGSPELVAQIASFGREAKLASLPDARLAPGQLRRGSLDGLYVSLRAHADGARAQLVLDARESRGRWARTVSVVLALAAAAATGLCLLILGPVQSRLAQQRRDAQLVVAAREREFARTTAISRATTAVLRHHDARATVCQAAMDVVAGATAALWEDDGHGDLVCTAAAGGDVFGMRLPIDGSSVTAIAFTTARAQFSHDVNTNPDIDTSARDALSEACGRSLVAGAWVPVVLGGRCRAVLSIGFDEHLDVSEHLPTLEIFATETAVALDRQDLLRRLADDAESDHLTGAANRRAWDDALPRAVYSARATGAALSIVMLDLDHFKTYNDTHGHPAGDTLLRQTVAAWRQTLRPGDMLARYGGEEFAVLLPGADLTYATRTADRLRQLMPGGATCSAGAAQLSTAYGNETATDLVVRADQALYESKHHGRNRTTALALPRQRRTPGGTTPADA